MRRIIWIILALVVIVVAVVAWRKNANPVVLNADGTVNGEYSIKDVTALKKDLQCDVRRSDASSTVIGSVVTSGGKARGDFDISTESVDTQFASHFILDNGTIYTWTSLAQVGYRSDPKRGIPQGGVIGINEQTPLSCRSWNADLTRFQLPSGINFQEVK